MSSRPTSLILARFVRIPALSRETWQGAVFRMPAWVEDGGPGGQPWRPWGAIWASASTGRMFATMQEAWQAEPPLVELALQGLLQFANQELKARTLSGRASRLQVEGPDLALALSSVFAETGVTVEAVPEAGAAREALRYLDERVYEHEAAPPGPLAGEGVTADVYRGFAEAAAEFYRAAPWVGLEDIDPIAVESPAPPPGYGVAAVMGAGGVTLGVAFYGSDAIYREMLAGQDPEALLADEPARSVVFDVANAIPYGDHDLWLDHQLPLAAPDAYPLLAAYHGQGRITRASRSEVVFAEAVMRALARTTEAQLRAARWTVDVPAGGRIVPVTLALPDVLKARDALTRHPPMDRRDEAEELTDAALGATGRVQLELIARALALSPDCVDAHLVLAERCAEAAGMMEKARLSGEGTHHDVILAAATALRARELAHARDAADAGRRRLGDRFDALRGRVSDDEAGRAYLDARFSYACTLGERGRVDDARAEYRELLALDAADMVGAAEALACLLVEHHRDAEAEVLFRERGAGTSLTTGWAHLLWRYHQRQDTAETRDELKALVDRNPLVSTYLLDPGLMDEAMAEDLDEPVPTDDERAQAQRLAFDVVSSLERAFEDSPGALDWLRRQVAPRRRPSRPSRRGTGRRQRR